MTDKLIELCRNASLQIKLALLVWSVSMLLSDTRLETGTSFN